MDLANLETLRRQLREHFDFLERFAATLAIDEAVALADLHVIHSLIGDFRLYLALTESDAGE
jgi:hypothetical protein